MFNGIFTTKKTLLKRIEKLEKEMDKVKSAANYQYGSYWNILFTNHQTPHTITASEAIRLILKRLGLKIVNTEVVPEQFELRKLDEGVKKHAKST